MHLQKHYLTFDVNPNPKVKVTQNVAQFPLHHVIYAPAKFAVGPFKGLRGDAFTRNLTVGQTDRWMHKRRTDFGKKFITFFLKIKAVVKNRYDLN